MKSIGDILPDIKKKAAEAPKGRKRQTERGELMRFFLRHLNHSRARRSRADDDGASRHRVGENPDAGFVLFKKRLQSGKELQQKFWWELDPTKIHLAIIFGT